jgi:hypothetical protein
MKDMRLACDLAALTPEQRQRHGQLMRQLVEATESIRELPDGFEFRYRTDEGTWLLVAEYVELERRCCPFFHFALIREPDGGPVSLRMSGGDGVKPFLRAQIHGATT